MKPMNLGEEEAFNLEGNNVEQASELLCYKGERLVDYIKNSNLVNYNLRYCVEDVLDYCAKNGNFSDRKLLLLSGLRRTGKTTIIEQSINNLLSAGISSEHISYYIVSYTDASALELVKLLQEDNSKYIFVDEVTNLIDFVKCSLAVYEIVHFKDKRIILSGTDSFALALAMQHSLYDRCYTCHTTLLSTKSFCIYILMILSLH